MWAALYQPIFVASQYIKSRVTGLGISVPKNSNTFCDTYLSYFYSYLPHLFVIG